MARSAILSHVDHTLLINDDDTREVVVPPVPVQYSEHESLDVWVAREVRKHGYALTGNDFDTEDYTETIYRLREATAKGTPLPRRKQRRKV